MIKFPNFNFYNDFLSNFIAIYSNIFNFWFKNVIEPDFYFYNKNIKIFLIYKMSFSPYLWSNLQIFYLITFFNQIIYLYTSLFLFIDIKMIESKVFIFIKKYKNIFNL